MWIILYFFRKQLIFIFQIYFPFSVNTTQCRKTFHVFRCFLFSLFLSSFFYFSIWIHQIYGYVKFYKKTNYLLKSWLIDAISKRTLHRTSPTLLIVLAIKSNDDGNLKRKERPNTSYTEKLTKAEKAFTCVHNMLDDGVE